MHAATHWSQQWMIMIPTGKTTPIMNAVTMNEEGFSKVKTHFSAKNLCVEGGKTT